jgi:hypothetical protein
LVARAVMLLHSGGICSKEASLWSLRTTCDAKRVTVSTKDDDDEVELREALLSCSDGYKQSKDGNIRGGDALRCEE